MKKNKKIFILIIFLLFFHETHQIALKSKLQKNAFPPYLTEAISEKNAKKFIIKVIGKEKWIELTNLLDPLGSKWKNRILSVVYISFFIYHLLFINFVNY